MGFLDRLLGGDDDGQEDGAARAARETDVARVAAGGIPAHAERRIAELAAGRTAFTSGLSIADFALTRGAGVRPVCQVMGSSVYKVGWQNYPWGSNWFQDAESTELTTLTDAWNEARRLAIGRLAEEARIAGCHAVVDVTFEDRRHDFLSDEIEVVITGTAVHLDGETLDGPAVLSDLTMPEFVLLRRAGYHPVGIAAATSVHYVVPGRDTRRMTTGWQRLQPNAELKDFTQGVYDARQRAIFRARQQAAEAGAHGIVGVRIEQDVREREVERNDQKRIDLIATFHVLGTAIVEEPDHRPIAPDLVVRQGARRP